MIFRVDHYQPRLVNWEGEGLRHQGYERSSATRSVIAQSQLSGSFVRHVKEQRQNAGNTGRNRRSKSILAMIKTHADSNDSLPSAGRVFVH